MQSGPMSGPNRKPKFAIFKLQMEMYLWQQHEANDDDDPNDDDLCTNSN